MTPTMFFRIYVQAVFDAAKSIGFGFGFCRVFEVDRNILLIDVTNVSPPVCSAHLFAIHYSCGVFDAGLLIFSHPLRRH